jgi:hypothetical protein
MFLLPAPNENWANSVPKPLNTEPSIYSLVDPRLVYGLIPLNRLLVTADMKANIFNYCSHDV